MDRLCGFWVGLVGPLWDCVGDGRVVSIAEIRELFNKLIREKVRPKDQCPARVDIGISRSEK